MPSLFELAAARRAEIEAEIRRIDVFLDKAEDLLARRLRDAMQVSPHASRGENVIPFPSLRAEGLATTTDETGA